MFERKRLVMIGHHPVHHQPSFLDGQEDGTQYPAVLNHIILVFDWYLIRRQV
jgi:hypothetical protein